MTSQMLMTEALIDAGVCGTVQRLSRENTFASQRLTTTECLSSNLTGSPMVSSCVVLNVLLSPGQTQEVSCSEATRSNGLLDTSTLNHAHGGQVSCSPWLTSKNLLESQLAPECPKARCCLNGTH